MRSPLQFVFIAGLIIGPATAQIPLPAFNRTFSATTLTRGFWFQTPVQIVVTGLQVPDEANNGQQNVELILLPGVPPAYPGTVTGTQMFYAAGVPSSQVISTVQIFNPGDYIGVLGACGNASTMYNSYGPTGPFTSNVLGNPITLTRFGTQTNIAATGGNGPCWQEAAYEVSRVKIFVAGQASAIGYGQGCGGPAGAPRLDTNAGPAINTTAQLALTQNDSANLGAILGAGFGQISVPLFGCTLLVSPVATLAFNPAPVPVGQTSISFPIPNNTGLLGVVIDFQAGVLVPTLPNGVTMTNGVEWTIGY
jgi:hypothetical protein